MGDKPGSDCVTRKVLVEWDGWKRGSLPAGGRYSTLARFPEVPEALSSESAWSIILDFDDPPALQGSPSLGSARFLSDKGPHDWLRVGSSFEMYEGSKRSAVVSVVA